jgi:hypothetical protein
MDGLLSMNATYLQQIGGIFWILTYILIIIRGFKDKSYGMPILALLINITYEFIFAFQHPHKGPWTIIYIVWFLFDIIIFAQALRWGTSEIKNSWLKQYFHHLVYIGTMGCYYLVYWAIFKIDYYGGYIGFGENLLMSVLFINMLLQRDSIRGQSIYIGLFKFTGTIFSSIGNFVARPDDMIYLALYLSIFVADGVYLLLFLKLCRKKNEDCWTRL